MFKRIEKKQKKQADDEERGLDEETKQILGMHDTDSDESDSGSDSDSDSDSDGSGADLDGMAEGSGGDMEAEWIGADGGEDSDAENDAEGDSSDEEEPPMTTSEAIKDPIYKSPADPGIRACIVCPKKVFKNDKMVEVHLASSAHGRHFKKFCEVAQTHSHGSKQRMDNPIHIMTTILSSQVAPAVAENGTSNRAVKRKEKLEKVIKRRAVRKEMIAKKKRKRDAAAAGKPNVPASGDPSSSAAAKDAIQSEKPPRPVKYDASKQGSQDRDEAAPSVGELKKKKKRRRDAAGTSQATMTSDTVVSATSAGIAETPIPLSAEQRPSKDEATPSQDRPKKKQKLAKDRQPESSTSEPTSMHSGERKKKREKKTFFLAAEPSLVKKATPAPPRKAKQGSHFSGTPKGAGTRYFVEKSTSKEKKGVKGSASEKQHGTNGKVENALAERKEKKGKAKAGEGRGLLIFD